MCNTNNLVHTRASEVLLLLSKSNKLQFHLPSRFYRLRWQLWSEERCKRNILCQLCGPESKSQVVISTCSVSTCNSTCSSRPLLKAACRLPGWAVTSQHRCAHGNRAAHSPPSVALEQSLLLWDSCSETEQLQTLRS